MAKYKIINGEGIIPNGTTEIEDYAFSWSQELKSITIPTSVTKIGNRAFNECWKLTSVTISTSVTEIGEGAFEGCKRLESITIPKSVKKIGNSLLCECPKLASIIVAEGNTVYDSRGNSNAIIETKTNRLIQGCANTVIPDSVTEIGKRAFFNCKALTNITITESVTEIGDRAFPDFVNVSPKIRR